MIFPTELILERIRDWGSDLILLGNGNLQVRHAERLPPPMLACIRRRKADLVELLTKTMPQEQPVIQETHQPRKAR